MKPSKGVTEAHEDAWPKGDKREKQGKRQKKKEKKGRTLCSGEESHAEKKPCMKFSLTR